MFGLVRFGLVKLPPKSGKMGKLRKTEQSGK